MSGAIDRAAAIVLVEAALKDLSRFDTASADGFDAWYAASEKRRLAERTLANELQLVGARIGDGSTHNFSFAGIHTSSTSSFTGSLQHWLKKARKA